MVRFFIILILSSVSAIATNSFDKNCIQCHRKLSSSPQDIMKYYLLTYSGENNVKMGMDHYMKHPSKDISAMPAQFLSEYGIKTHQKLSDEELNEALNIFWERYKVMNRLK
jgi:hypothetical protein